MYTTPRLGEGEDHTCSVGTVYGLTGLRVFGGAYVPRLYTALEGNQKQMKELRASS